MRKGLCSKCNHLISVDENVNPFECPECHQQINALDAIKNYNRTANTYKRKAELCFMGSTNYPKAFENYSKLLELADDMLTVLTATSLSKLYCSDLHNIYIKEATDILIKGSDKVEVNNDNVKILSEFLKKFRNDCLLIITAFSARKTTSRYALNLYTKSLNEYIYFLNSYMEIYTSLDKLNKYFAEGKDVIEEEIKKAQARLSEKVVVKNENDTKHDFYDLNNKVITEIFPNKKLIFKARMALYALMGVGFICCIVSLILLSTQENKLVAGILIAISLALFIGGYFGGHYLKGKNYNLDY